MRVFKYRSNYGRDLITLTCNQLFALKYEDLNDPFESMQFMIQYMMNHSLIVCPI